MLTERRLMAGMLLAFLLPVFNVQAGKPQDDSGLFLGNNFPSGPHFNLILHGKKADHQCVTEIQITQVIDTDLVDDTPANYAVGDKFAPGNCPTQAGYTYVCQYGNVVTMPRGSDSIQLLMESGRSGPPNKDGDPDINSSVLQVTDACSGFTANDPAIVRLPGNKDGYAVYGRVLGKPGDDGGPAFTVSGRDIPVIGDSTTNDGVVWLAGVITQDGTYIPASCDDGNGGCTLTRWDSTTNGKGAKKATDITGLFMFTGSVCYWDLDEACFSDGVLGGVDDPDYICTQESFCCGLVTDLSGLGDIEVDGNSYRCRFLGDPLLDTCPNPAIDPVFDSNDVEIVYDTHDMYCRTVEEPAWIFNLADFVNVIFDINNDAYNVQIRLYPLPLQ